jgi:hypothetical protein
MTKQRIIQAKEETVALLAKYMAKAGLPAESALEIERQKQMAFCRKHLTRLDSMLAAAN